MSDEPIAGPRRRRRRAGGPTPPDPIDIAMTAEALGKPAEGAAHGLPLAANVDVGTLCVFAMPERPAGYLDTLSSDFAAYRELARSLLERGVHVIPRGLTYVSTAHDDRDIDETCAVIADAVAATAERLERGSVAG